MAFSSVQLPIAKIWCKLKIEYLLGLGQEATNKLTTVKNVTQTVWNSGKLLKQIQFKRIFVVYFYFCLLVFVLIFALTIRYANISLE